jgi:hypothetical protein
MFTGLKIGTVLADVRVHVHSPSAPQPYPFACAGHFTTRNKKSADFLQRPSHLHHGTTGSAVCRHLRRHGRGLPSVATSAGIRPTPSSAPPRSAPLSSSAGAAPADLSHLRLLRPGFLRPRPLPRHRRLEAGLRTLSPDPHHGSQEPGGSPLRSDPRRVCRQQRGPA